MPETELTPAAALAAAKARYPHRMQGKRAEVPFETWQEYLLLGVELAEVQAQRDAVEAEIREHAADAQILTIHGIKVATRIITVVTGASFTKDYYRRTAGESDTSTDD